MKTTEEEKAKMFPISLYPSMKERIDRRVKLLRPRVSSFSNYVQQLIALDEEHGILGKPASTLNEKGKSRPFECDPHNGIVGVAGSIPVGSTILKPAQDSPIDGDDLLQLPLPFFSFFAHAELPAAA